MRLISVAEVFWWGALTLFFVLFTAGAVAWGPRALWSGIVFGVFGMTCALNLVVAVKTRKERGRP